MTSNLMNLRRRWWALLAVATWVGLAEGRGSWAAGDPAPAAASLAAAPELPLRLRTRLETKAGSGLYYTVLTPETWDSARLAVIVCDVWDSHHCLNAVRRVQEMAPRMNRLLQVLRQRGALIIHAPSGCMSTYENHPARRRAKDAPRATNLPPDIGQWCHRIPAEEKGTYPIDQADGGEDDEPGEHARWADQLRAQGRNPRAPWKSQIDVLEIQDQDAISDSGAEVWNLLEQRGIRNVILFGVHTNMCVLGRPFGLRQLAKNGKHVVLVRDLTDTMYNPQRAPQVSHFSGTDLIVEHIEKFVCPTITSDQLLGDRSFRFSLDRRPHVVLAMSEPEYKTETTVTEFARRVLQRDFRLSFLYQDPADPNGLAGAEALEDADLAVISVRRRALPKEQLELYRRLVAAGKAVVGLRTASHAFALGQGTPPAGRDVWPEFDRDVLGGNYRGHHSNKDAAGYVTYVWVQPDQAAHPILQGVPTGEFRVHSSLYQTSPLGPRTMSLMWGRAREGSPQEPVAWTNTSVGGGRVFYTSLGGPDDFGLPAFQRLLTNAVYWAAGREPPTP
jgi:type 1 glutamine amidotransferase/nicotinamidase-related amidase